MIIQTTIIHQFLWNLFHLIDLFIRIRRVSFIRNQVCEVMGTANMTISQAVPRAKYGHHFIFVLLSPLHLRVLPCSYAVAISQKFAGLAFSRELITIPYQVTKYLRSQ